MPATLPLPKDAEATRLAATDWPSIAHVDDRSKVAVRREMKRAAEAGG